MLLAISVQTVFSILFAVLIILLAILVILYILGRRLQEKQMPIYARLTKLPVVKAKVGPKVLTLMADPSVYEILPLKKEVKVAVSGIYIRSVKSVRGGTIPEQPKKKGFLAKLRGKAENAVKEAKTEQGKKKK